MNEIAHQVRPAVTTVEMRVQEVRVSLVAKGRRDHERGRWGKPSGMIIARWLRRELVRTGWRFVATGPLTVEWSDADPEHFVRNLRRWSAAIPLVFPPAGVLEGVDAMETSADVLAATLMSPSPARPTR